MQLEVAAALDHDVADVYLPEEEAQIILMQGASDANLLRAEAAQLDSEKQIFGDAMRNAFRSSTQRFSSRSERNKLGREWFRDPVPVVRDWAIDYMRRHRKDLRLPADEQTWPAPEMLATIWGDRAYWCAHISRSHQNDSPAKENDYADWRHYVAAMYADDLIVEDGGFRAIAEMCPPPKPRVLRLAAWVEEILRSPDA